MLWTTLRARFLCVHIRPPARGHLPISVYLSRCLSVATSIHRYVYIYIYIYIHVCICVFVLRAMSSEARDLRPPAIKQLPSESSSCEHREGNKMYLDACTRAHVYTCMHENRATSPSVYAYVCGDNSSNKITSCEQGRDRTTTNMKLKLEVRRRCNKNI